MALQTIILLFGLVSSVVCNIDTHVYPEDCAPPGGFDSNDTGVIIPPDYVTLPPIAYCCPHTEKCKHLGGFCALKWAVDLYPECCDFVPTEPCRDYSCKCCVICGDDKCSPCVETGGNCREHCHPGELLDQTNVCSYHNNGSGCQCCKKCEPTSECSLAYGICATDAEWCPFGTFPSSGCCGGCVCCKPVFEPVTGSNCEYSGGYCLEEGGECANGYYACFGECVKTLFHAGLKSEVLGTCCIPKQTAVNRRIDQHPMKISQDTRRHPKQLLD